MIQDRAILTHLRRTIDEHLEILSSQEIPVIGWCCSYLPVEVLEAAGFLPLRLVPLPPAEMGDACLGPNFCPYVRAIMGEGLADTYPFLSGLVLMNTCDGMRRLRDAWSYFHGVRFVHLMDLPRITTSSAIGYFREEIQDLVERISASFGVSISADTLKACFGTSNQTRALLGEVQRLVCQGRLELTASELIEIFRAGGILPREKYHSLLEGVIDASDNGKNRRGVPILLTGSMLENPEVLSIIEEYGGWVVVQDLCLSGRRSENPIPLAGDPLMALARHYLLKPPCARMQQSQRRIDYILSLVRSYEVQGVIYYVLKFCDTFLHEAPRLKEALDRRGIPMLIIESEYRQGRGGGIQTRIQAFLEMLNAGGSSDRRRPVSDGTFGRLAH